MRLPPLVPPVADGLGPAQVRRHSRQVMLPGFGRQAQQRLAASRVLVVGAGGLGSPVLLYLAAAGVGTLGIVDDDVVDASNSQRQVIHGAGDVGRSKAASARDAVARLDPDVRVVLHEQRLTASTALDVMAGYDVVVDGADNFPTRYLVNDAAAMLGRPYVWGSVSGYDGQASVFWSGHGPTYRDLHPLPPEPGTVPSCAEGGVLGPVCGLIGSVMATEAVKLVTGLGETLLGRLLVVDALGLTFDVVPLRADPGAAPVDALVDYEDFCGTPAAQTDDVPAVDAATLARWLDERAAGERAFTLVDVREPGEREINAIPGSVLVPRARLLRGEGLDELPAGRPVVFYCRSGVRSAQAVRVAVAAGRADVLHLAGGVEAWVVQVDPGQARY